MLYGLELSKAGLDHRADDRARDRFFFDLLGLLLANVVAVLLALFISTKWARGFFLVGLLVLLISLGTCGYNLSRMHVNGVVQRLRLVQPA